MKFFDSAAAGGDLAAGRIHGFLREWLQGTRGVSREWVALLPASQSSPKLPATPLILNFNGWRRLALCSVVLCGSAAAQVSPFRRSAEPIDQGAGLRHVRPHPEHGLELLDRIPGLPGKARKQEAELEMGLVVSRLERDHRP